MNVETTGMPAALALASAPATSAGSTASSTMPSALAVTACWIALFHVAGSPLPSATVTFQPSALPASCTPRPPCTHP